MLKSSMAAGTTIANEHASVELEKALLGIWFFICHLDKLSSDRSECRVNVDSGGFRRRYQQHLVAGEHNFNWSTVLAAIVH